MRDRKPGKVEGGDVSREDAKVRKDRKEEQGLSTAGCNRGILWGWKQAVFCFGLPIMAPRCRRSRTADAAGNGAVFVGGRSRAAAGRFLAPPVRRSPRTRGGVERAVCVLLLFRGGTPPGPLGRRNALHGIPLDKPRGAAFPFGTIGFTGRQRGRPGDRTPCP